MTKGFFTNSISWILDFSKLDKVFEDQGSDLKLGLEAALGVLMETIKLSPKHPKSYL